MKCSEMEMGEGAVWREVCEGGCVGPAASVELGEGVVALMEAARGRGAEGEEGRVRGGWDEGRFFDTLAEAQAWVETSLRPSVPDVPVMTESAPDGGERGVSEWSSPGWQGFRAISRGREEERVLAAVEWERDPGAAEAGYHPYVWSRGVGYIIARPAGEGGFGTLAEAREWADEQLRAQGWVLPLSPPPLAPREDLRLQGRALLDGDGEVVGYAWLTESGRYRACALACGTSEMESCHSAGFGTSGEATAWMMAVATGQPLRPCAGQDSRSA